MILPINERTQLVKKEGHEFSVMQPVGVQADGSQALYACNYPASEIQIICDVFDVDRYKTITEGVFEIAHGLNPDAFYYGSMSAGGLSETPSGMVGCNDEPILRTIGTDKVMVGRSLMGFFE